MIDRDAQQVLDAEHLEQQRVTSRLATEVHLLREVAEAARRFHAANAEAASFGEYVQAEEELWAALAAYDDAVTATESHQDGHTAPAASADTPGSGGSP